MPRPDPAPVLKEVQRLVEAQMEVSPEEVRKVKLDVSWLSEDTALMRDVLQEVLEQGGPRARDVVAMTFLWKDRHPFDKENLSRSHVFMTWCCQGLVARDGLTPTLRPYFEETLQEILEQNPVEDCSLFRRLVKDRFFDPRSEASMCLVQEMYAARKPLLHENPALEEDYNWILQHTGFQVNSAGELEPLELFPFVLHLAHGDFSLKDRHLEIINARRVERGEDPLSKMDVWELRGPIYLDETSLRCNPDVIEAVRCAPQEKKGLAVCWAPKRFQHLMKVDENDGYENVAFRAPKGYFFAWKNNERRALSMSCFENAVLSLHSSVLLHVISTPTKPSRQVLSALVTVAIAAVNTLVPQLQAGAGSAFCAGVADKLAAHQSSFLVVKRRAALGALKRVHGSLSPCLCFAVFVDPSFIANRRK